MAGSTFSAEAGEERTLELVLLPEYERLQVTSWNMWK